MKIIRDRYGRKSNSQVFGNHEPLPDRWETSGSVTYLGYGGDDDSRPMAIHRIEETATGGTRKIAFGLWSQRESLTYRSVNSYFSEEV